VSAPPTNALSFNLYVQQIGILAVALTQETSGVYSFVDPPLQGLLPSMLNYSELRINRDLDLLASQGSNIYTLTAGQSVLKVPVNDFVTVQTLELLQQSNGQTVNSWPLVGVSKEFIQNVYGGLASANAPKYYAMVGDQFGSEEDTNTNILLGPVPNYGYSVRITGTSYAPSLYQSASAGPADTAFTYISAFYPDLLILASMIYVSAFQRNWSSTADDVPMAQSYEKQYQALRLGAIAMENRRKQEGSSWSAYSTPTAATPTR
jgi:hypothetical protein